MVLGGISMNVEKIKEILDGTDISATDELDVLEYVNDLVDTLKHINEYVENQSVSNVELRLIIKELLDDWVL